MQRCHGNAGSRPGLWPVTSPNTGIVCAIYTLAIVIDIILGV